MTQSKLELHLEILKAVALRNPIGEGEVAFWTKNTIDVTQQSLIFLSNQGLIKRSQRGAYQVATRGLAVLKHFNLLTEQAGLIENY
jgi:predicted transcriptional regulator